MVPTGTSVAPNKINSARIVNFTCPFHRCRLHEHGKGWGGWGEMIWVRHSAPFSPGYTPVTMRDREIGHCSATLYRRYDYELPINIAGIYRPPGYKHPSYAAALAQVMAGFQDKCMTAHIAGDLNVTSWKKEFFWMGRGRGALGSIQSVNAHV